MKHISLLFFIITISTLANDSTSSESTSLPWKRVSVKAGGFLSRVNSNFGFRPQDGGVKVTVDSEDQLKLDEKNRAFRVGKRANQK